MRCKQKTFDSGDYYRNQDLEKKFEKEGKEDEMDVQAKLVENKYSGFNKKKPKHELEV